MPKTRGRELVVRLFVDSDHAADKFTRRSRSGYILFLNSAPISWYSKKQGTIETSVFGAEFVAMKTGFEVSRALRYKIRMMGIPLDEPTYCYGDNMFVIHNTQRPESILRKKSNSICYHFAGKPSQRVNVGQPTFVPWTTRPTYAPSSSLVTSNETAYAALYATISEVLSLDWSSPRQGFEGSLRCLAIIVVMAKYRASHYELATLLSSRGPN
jgi:hypothetical protein